MSKNLEISRRGAEAQSCVLVSGCEILVFWVWLVLQLYECEQLLPQDFSRIAELNTQYRDLPGDFADLSLIVISERLDIAAMPAAEYAYATLDSDFDIYRRYRKKPFESVF